MRTRAAPWWQPLLLVLATLAAFVPQPGSPTTAIAVPGLIMISATLVLLISLLVAVARKQPRRRLIMMAVSLVVCFGLAALAYYGGSFRLRWILSRERLHDAAMLTVQGNPPATPTRIGGFKTDSITLDGGIVRIRTHSDGTVEEGFAFFPGELPAEVDDFTYMRFEFHRGQWYLYQRDIGGT